MNTVVLPRFEWFPGALLVARIGMISKWQSERTTILPFTFPCLPYNVSTLQEHIFFIYFWIADEITLKDGKKVLMFERLFQYMKSFEILISIEMFFSKKSRQIPWPELGHAQFNICKMFTFKSEMAVNASLKHGKGARKISCQLAFATTPAKNYGVRGILL